MGKGVIRSIDSLGRIVIPKEYRKSLSINNLDKLELSLNDNKIEIEKCNQEDSFLKQMNLYFKSFNNIFPDRVFFGDYENIYAFTKKKPEKAQIKVNRFNKIQYKDEDIILFNKHYHGYFLVPLYDFSSFLGFIVVIDNYSELSKVELLYKFIKN